MKFSLKIKDNRCLSDPNAVVAQLHFRGKIPEFQHRLIACNSVGVDDCSTLRIVVKSGQNWMVGAEQQSKLRAVIKLQEIIRGRHPCCARIAVARPPGASHRSLGSQSRWTSHHGLAVTWKWRLVSDPVPSLPDPEGGHAIPAHEALVDIPPPTHVPST